MGTVILYVRRSLDSDPPAAEMLAPLRAWAIEAGHAIAGEYIDDSTEHGRVRAPQPKKDRAIYDLMRGAADCLVVPELRTLGVGLAALRRTLAELEAAGARLYVAALGLDLMAPAAAEFRRVLDVLLALHSDYSRETAKRMHGRAKAQGVRLGGPRVAPSLEAKIESLLLSGVVPDRIRKLTHCGPGTITRIRKRLLAEGMVKLLSGNRYVTTERGRAARQAAHARPTEEAAP